MKKTILLYFIFFSPFSVFGQASYTTSCEIRNGVAYGSVHNHSKAFEISGYVWFSFYDSTGLRVAKEDEYEYEYVSASTTEEIEYTSAPGNACRCSFDVSKATTVQNSPPYTGTVSGDNPDLPYSTSCQVRNGTAYGYVHNHEKAFEISGYVWFTFYDSTGAYKGKEDEYEYEYVSAKSTEEIEYTSAPAGTCKCSFDVSKATTTPNTSPSADSVAQPNSNQSYSTSCEIRNGTAYGSVHNNGDAFEISGNVWFYFYNTDGSLIDSEDEYEYEYVSRTSTEEVEYTSAPSGACRCTFVISGAISE